MWEKFVMWLCGLVRVHEQGLRLRGRLLPREENLWLQWTLLACHGMWLRYPVLLLKASR